MATIRLIPSTIYNAASSYVTISNPDRAYTNTDSTTYATATNTNASTSNRYIYIRGFNFDDVPSNAVVSSFTIKIKAYQSGGSTSSSYTPRLCDDTTTITGSCSAITTSTQTLSFTGVTEDWDTIKGHGSNFGIRINCRRNNRNTQSVFYIYGAEINVTYTLPVYHNVTVTNNTSGTVTPTGTTSLEEGDDFTLLINGVNSPTVTDNNVDVTSQLVRVTSSTDTYIPYDNTSSGFNITSISNAYTDISDSSYADCSLSGRTTGTLYLDLGPINLPSGATISSVSCQASLQISRNGSSSSMTAECQMYSGSTAKGSSTTLVSSATDVARTTYTLNIGSWTISELQSARFYVTMYNGASSTVRHIYVYGVSFTVTYTVSGIVYKYTISNVTSDHTIVISSSGQTWSIYLKENGSWVQYSKVYLKVNGSWVEQSDPGSILSTTANYTHAGGS